MEKFVKVIDNAIHPTLIGAIEDLTTNPLSKLEWKYQTHIGSDKNKLYSPGFAHHFIGGSNPDKITSKSFGYLLMQPLYSFAENQNIVVTKIYNGRAFLQVPTIKTNEIFPHKDSNQPHFVLLYYITDSDGDTIFFEDDKKTEIQRVSPKKGRAVFFDGSIFHSSSVPSKTHRIVINYNWHGNII